jgi:hypothetical protein
MRGNTSLGWIRFRWAVVPIIREGGISPIRRLISAGVCWLLASVPIAVPPIYQALCKPDAESEQKRNAMNERAIMLRKARTLQGYSIQDGDDQTIAGIHAGISVDAAAFVHDLDCPVVGGLRTTKGRL